MNIQHISDSYSCSACGACNAVCGRSAIKFQWTSIGRKYVKVSDHCTDCGLCLKVCPKINVINAPIEPHSYYVGRSLDSNAYRNAQSGGACTAILSYLLDSGKIDAAVMCRMDYGSTPDVHAVTITSSQELYACQKSCYTPVDVLSALKDCKRYKSVAVVGLPCHIQGATNLQKIPTFKNIKYKIGLFCERTLCRTIQDTLVSYASTKAPVKIEWKKKDFTYNGKSYTYRKAPLVLSTEDNNMIIMPNSVRFALKNNFTPPIAGYAMIS